MTFDSLHDEVNFFEPVIPPILPVVFGDFYSLGPCHLYRLNVIRDRKKIFRNFFKIMLPTGLHSPGPHESIALWSDAKFEREHAFRN